MSTYTPNSHGWGGLGVRVHGAEARLCAGLGEERPAERGGTRPDPEELGTADGDRRTAALGVGA